ncbi:hypothetical protein ACHAWF_004963 [Thalassiosira exigua]
MVETTTLLRRHFRHTGVGNGNDDDDRRANVGQCPHERRRWPRRIRRLRAAALVVALAALASAASVAAHRHRRRRAPPSEPPIRRSYVPPSNGTANEFLRAFERTVGSPDLSRLDAAFPGSVAYALVARGDRILCRRSHRDAIAAARLRDYVEMLREGLRSVGGGDDVARSAGGLPLPVLLLDGDNPGCFARDRKEYLSFPRLTWSIPSPLLGRGWCQAVGMPGYEGWSIGKQQSARRNSWFVDHTWGPIFRKHERKYPWKSKIDRAVWRGTTTGGVEELRHIPHGEEEASAFDDIPRARFVRKSLERPDLIDAGFTAFVQRWAPREEEIKPRTRLVDSMMFEDQMKYRATIDIDGNNWSSRFSMLLCMNSVVIKVRVRRCIVIWAVQPMLTGFRLCFNGKSPMDRR